MRGRVCVIVIATVASAGAFACDYAGSMSPDELAEILVHDEKRGGRALHEAMSLGDEMLEPLRHETGDFRALKTPSLFLVSKVLACNPSPASEGVLEELLQRPEPAARLVGAVGMAVHGRLADDLEEYLLRVAEGRFDEAEKATASIQEAPGEYNASTLTAYRRLAIQALGHANKERATDTLIGILRDCEAGPLHGAAMDALERISGEEALPVFQQALTEECFDSRPEALRALVRLGDRTAPGLAIDRLDDDRHGLLARELELLTGVYPGSTPESWRDWWETNEETWNPIPNRPPTVTWCDN